MDNPLTVIRGFRDAARCVLFALCQDRATALGPGCALPARLLRRRVSTGSGLGPRPCTGLFAPYPSFLIPPAIGICTLRLPVSVGPSRLPPNFELPARVRRR